MMRSASLFFLVLATLPAEADTKPRDYANAIIEECRTERERAASDSFDPFSSFEVLVATDETMSVEQVRSCIARKFQSDAKFVSGYFALLSDLPGEQSRRIHMSVARHIEAQRFTADPLGPWQLAANGCKLISDIEEEIACFDAVMRSVPDRLNR